MERSKYDFDEKHEQCYLYILDIIDTKLYKEPVKAVKQARKNVCTVRFINNGIDDIRLSQIFNLPEVIATLPEELQEKDEIPSVAMKLDPPIRNKILNYRQTLSALNIEIDEDVAFLSGQLSCECSISPFCDPHHKHIVTGDLRVIEHNKLRKLFSKGLNCREKKSTNYSKCLNEIEFSIGSFITSTVDKYQNVTLHHFKNWEDLVRQKVRYKIRDLKTKHTFQQTKSILDDDDVKTYLAELHKNFVIVPIDKASDNIAIVCKKFYVSRLFEELGIPGNTSDTYMLATKIKDDIITNNLSLCVKYGLELTVSQMTLPFMYWMPKMHYSPSRARFIVASSTCSSKPLSQAISKVFKLLFHQVQNFHAKSTFYKNYNRFWVIENSSPIIEQLNSLNSKKKAKDISTYDFSTLYAKLKHSDLVQVLKGIIDFAQKGGRRKEDGNRKFISFSKMEAFWCKKRRGKMCFSMPELKALTDHLITETYFEFGNLVFRQSIGIPMGIDPAPFWANLYLHKYESDHITNLMRSDKRRALMYRNASRFIDDECNLNDCGEFGRSFHLIYPSDLHLKCEHNGTHATFLELDISIVDGLFIYKLYDKRDDFPFHIIRMPDKNGNIPLHVFYGSIMSEFLRIARATLLFSDFLPRAKALFERMIKQDGEKSRVLAQIQRAMHRHPKPFIKFALTSQQIITSITGNEFH